MTNIKVLLHLDQAPLSYVTLENERMLDWEIYSTVGKAMRQQSSECSVGSEL